MKLSKYAILGLLTLLLVTLSVTAFAQPELTPGADSGSWLIDMIQFLIVQAKGGMWQPFMVGLLMLITTLGNFILTKLGTGFSAGTLSWVGMILGLLTTLGLNIAAMTTGATQMDWISAITSGIVMGGAQAGFWSTLGKKFFGDFAIAKPTPLVK